MEIKTDLHRYRWIDLSIFGVLYLLAVAVTCLQTSCLYLLLKLFLVMIMSVTLYGVIHYLFIQNKEKSNSISKYKHEFILLAVIITAYLPVMTQAYFFYDDYWSFDSGRDQISSGIFYARPVNGFWFEIFRFVTVRNVYCVRIFAILLLIIFGVLLYRWLVEKSGNSLFSLIIAISICLLSSVIDSVGYGSTFPFTLGIAGSAFSVISFEKTYIFMKGKHTIDTIIWMLISIASLLVGYMSYQLSTPIVFLFLAIYLYYVNNTKAKVISFLYVVFFGMVSLAYLLFAKLLSLMYRIPLNSRGEIINSLSALLDKISYFINIIMKQGIYQVLVSIFGNGLFHTTGRINVSLQLYNPYIGNIMIFLMLFFIMFAFIRLFTKPESILSVFVLLATIPLSCYSMFIMAESSYVSYYVFPLSATIFFFSLVGIHEFSYVILRIFDKYKIMKHRIRPEYVLVLILVAIAIQGSLYIQKFWVGYNKSGYEYVYHIIQSQYNKHSRIHLYGVLYPGQGNIYSVFTANTALKDLNLDSSKYWVTSSDNPFYVSIIEEQDFNAILPKLSEEDGSWLQTVYDYDKTYKRYSINLYNPDQQTLDRLKKCMNQSDVIPTDNSEAIVIDLPKIPVFYNDEAMSTFK